MYWNDRWELQNLRCVQEELHSLVLTPDLTELCRAVFCDFNTATNRSFGSISCNSREVCFWALWVHLLVHDTSLPEGDLFHERLWRWLILLRADSTPAQPHDLQHSYHRQIFRVPSGTANGIFCLAFLAARCSDRCHNWLHLSLRSHRPAKVDIEHLSLSVMNFCSLLQDRGSYMGAGCLRSRADPKTPEHLNLPGPSADPAGW